MRKLGFMVRGLINSTSAGASILIFNYVTVVATEAMEFGDRWVCARFGRLEPYPMVLETVLSKLALEKC